MKIVHAASYNYLKDGQSFYAPDYKFHNGFCRNNHFVYPFSTRDIARTSNIFGSKKFGINKTRERLVETCKNIMPELLILGTAEIIDGQTLEQIKKIVPNIKIAQWFVDPLWLEQHIQNINDKLPFLDTLFATTSGELLKQFKTNSNIVSYIPNICDSSVDTHRNFEKDNTELDFLFCGRDYKEPERQSFLIELSKSVSSVKNSFFGCLGNPPAFGNNYINLLGSTKMSISYNRRNDVELYMSDRITHLTGNGILTFSPKVPKMELLYSEDEVVYFDGIHDLTEKISELNSNSEKRKTIAKNGWYKTHESYNSTRVAKFMIEIIFHKNTKEVYEWNSEIYS